MTHASVLHAGPMQCRVTSADIYEDHGDSGLTSLCTAGLCTAGVFLFTVRFPGRDRRDSTRKYKTDAIDDSRKVSVG
jgi:hypothetical protein